MKVIMAVYRPSDDRESEVIGQVRITDNARVFINEWLAKVAPGHAAPRLFKVYTFDRGSTIPEWFGTERISVQKSERYWAGQVPL